MSNGRFRKGGSEGHDGPQDPGDLTDAQDRPHEDESPYYPPTAYTASILRAESELLRREALLAAERAEAPARVRELLLHPPARRRILVAERPRFRTYAVAEHLLDTCRRTWSDDPAHAESLAQLAAAVADAMDAAPPPAPDTVPIAAEPTPSPVLHTLRAQAWSYIANCRRIRSDLRAVPEAFRTARHHLAQGTGAPEDEVALLDLEASYLIDQRRLDEAERTLERVIEVYGEDEQWHMQGRAMVNLARLRREQGRPGDAVPLLREAMDRLDLSREPHLELAVYKNLALWLAEAGRAEEAQALLPKVRRIARKSASRLEWLRFLWAQGVIYHHLGRHELAAQAIQQARDGLLRERIGIDAALATLYLALVYLDAGDTCRAAALAEDLVPIFALGDLRGEALAALSVVRRAMEEQALTRRIVEEAVARLRRVHGGGGPLADSTVGPSA